MRDLPLDDRAKINFNMPVFTFDVNQISIWHPSQRRQGYENLVYIEYNYFEKEKVEIAVTPETIREITQGTPEHNLGWEAYRRLEKSQWFKSRPHGSTLILNEKESNELYLDMRHKLFPYMIDAQLTPNQWSDVSQLFFHTISSGATAINSVFVTMDDNFLEKSDMLYTCYGVQIMPPNEAWNKYEYDYNLDTPSRVEVDSLYNQQENLWNLIQSEMG